MVVLIGNFVEINQVRQVIAYKRYFLDFYEAQKDEVQRKIEWTLKFLQTIERIPRKFFKHIAGTDGLYEIRVRQGNDIFRIFAFFDKGNIIVLGNDFQKKTQKLPKSEIIKDLKIKKEYEKEQ